MADIGVNELVTDSIEEAESGFSDASSADTLNETEIRRTVHARINEIRADRRVDRLQYSQHIAERAEEHTETMAERRRLQGSDPESQYECETVGENVAYTYANQRIAVEDDYVNYEGNETKIAHGIVRQWMNSPGNQDVILEDAFESEGIGVATAETDDGRRVYVTQAVCG
ncbi:CAP domain-containing protein [Halobellus rubicundus]|uniref:CAP domain-containing protein n=1 Tax=Halobellus rubicundus TaxID=2996466 RepID=A0ABD5MB82_9EURY